MYFSQLWRLKVQGQDASTARFWWEPLDMVCRWQSSPVSSQALWGLFDKGTNPVLYLGPHYLPKAPRTSNTTRWSQDCSIWTLGWWGGWKGGDKHSVHNSKHAVSLIGENLRQSHLMAVSTGPTQTYVALRSLGCEVRRSWTPSIQDFPTKSDTLSNTTLTHWAWYIKSKSLTASEKALLFLKFIMRPFLHSLFWQFPIWNQVHPLSSLLNSLKASFLKFSWTRNCLFLWCFGYLTGLSLIHLIFVIHSFFW